MAASRHVGVRIFVDKQQAGPSLKRRIEIELVHDLVAVSDRLSRKFFEAFEQLLGLAPAVRFDQASDNVTTARLLVAGRGEHAIGLSNARSRTEKDLQMPAAFLLGESKQRVRRTSFCFVSGHMAPYRAIYVSPSSARLSL